jgi:TonB-linked SusC/RagA family outer membrane protein
MKKIYLNSQRLLLIAVAMFLVGSVFGQITITGTVLDGKFGGGLPGANVTVEGTTNGTITDLDGNFTINVSDQNAVLVFSFMGYSEVKKTVGTQTKIDVTLNEETVKVAEVVKIGYGVAKKEDITSAIVSVTGDQLADKPVMSADQALQGRAAGVQVKMNSGAPGSDMTVNIRGISSLGDSKPLYVVDGVPQDDIKGLNPGDIKDMAILKDASACAIYGTRAAYGVIIISTKDGGKAGKEEASVIEFTGYKGIQDATKRVELMNAEEYMNYRNLVNKEGDDEYFTQEEMDSINNAGGVDWQDAIFRQAVIENYQLSFSGSSAKTSYSVSGSYFNQEGIVKGSDYQRYTGRIKASHQLKKRLLVGESIGFNLVKKNDVDQGGMYNNVLNDAMKMRPVETEIYDTTTADIPRYWTSTYTNNPVGVIEKKSDVSDNYGMGGWMFAEYEVIDGLKLKAQGSFGIWNNQRSIFQKRFFVTSNFSNEVNSLEKRIYGGSNWNVSGTATYNKSLYAKKEDGTVDSSEVVHSITALVGTEADYREQDGYNTKNYNLSSELPSQWYMSTPASSTEVLQGSDYGNLPSEQSIASYLGRLEYGLLSKYNVNATYRIDGSSKFGSEERWGSFASFGGAWKIHKENFFKNNESLKFINDFKLRLGWGQIGNQSTAGAYDWAGTTSSDDGYIKPGEETRTSVINANAPANPYLKWENSETYNLGVDLGFLRNKIVFNSDFYIKYTNDMITRVPVPAVAGVETAPNVNASSMKNTGADFSLSYRKAEGEFNYSISGNISVYKNEVTDLGKNADGTDINIPGGYVEHPLAKYTNLTAKGHSVGEFYGYKTAGIYDSWEEINNGPEPLSGSAVAPGDLVIVDVNGDGVITPEDQTFIGSPHPDFIYGLSFEASYKGFDLSVAMSGSEGNENFNAMKIFIDGDLLGVNQSTRRLNAWTEENHTNEPAVDPARSKNHYSQVTDRYIEDASYIRLQSIQLGYTIPDNICKKIKISNMRVYVQAQNILTITDYSGYDPEVGTNDQVGWDPNGAKGPETGVDRGTYPVAKTYLAGLSFTF